MLIVNADDLGRSRRETDAVLECHAHGRITATSAMVFMADSQRAIGLARAAGLPVGLHLNLSEPFSSPDAPPELRLRHERVCGFLNATKYALLLFNPLRALDFAKDVDAQFAEFRRLYGAEPAHVDGHQHLHLAMNVLIQNLLPRGIRVRRNFSFGPGQKAAVNRGYRAVVDRMLARRHQLTHHFFSLSQQLLPEQLEGLFALARSGDVELMVHPVYEREFDVLMSAGFGRLMHVNGAQAPGASQ